MDVNTSRVPSTSHFGGWMVVKILAGDHHFLARDVSLGRAFFHQNPPTTVQTSVPRHPTIN